MHYRKLYFKEKNVIEFMINSADAKWFCLKNGLENILVSEMLDGGMGSLLFKNHSDSKRTLGEKICKAEFDDVDGISVSVHLNADQFGELFELDSLKFNSEELISWPDVSGLRLVDD